MEYSALAVLEVTIIKIIIHKRRSRFMGKKNFLLLILPFVIVLGFIVSCSKVQEPAQNTPPVTPKWALGHIVWEDSINTQDAALGLIEQYKKHNIPVDGIIIDSPWSQSYNDFNWDKARYPKPLEMIDQFKKENIKVILWLTGCINSSARDVPVQKDPDYDFAKEKGYVVNNGKESVWWKGPGMHLDFTNKEAVKWWNKKLDKVFVDGVYGWKVDQGEAVFCDNIINYLF
jgi:alpha-glucosidase (family GH31 glycosyl hydrolase)